jgi:hypothetical protein
LNVAEQFSFGFGGASLTKGELKSLKMPQVFIGKNYSSLTQLLISKETKKTSLVLPFSELKGDRLITRWGHSLSYIKESEQIFVIFGSPAPSDVVINL